MWKSNQGIVLSLLHRLTSCTQPCRIVWSLEFILLFLYFRIRYLTYSVEWELRLCLTKINAFLLWIGNFNKLINKCLNWNMIKHSLKKNSKLLSIICYMHDLLSFVCNITNDLFSYIINYCLKVHLYLLSYSDMENFGMRPPYSEGVHPGQMRQPRPHGPMMPEMYSPKHSPQMSPGQLPSLRPGQVNLSFSPNL